MVNKRVGRNGVQLVAEGVVSGVTSRGHKRMHTLETRQPTKQNELYLSRLHRRTRTITDDVQMELGIYKTRVRSKNKDTRSLHNSLLQ